MNCYARWFRWLVILGILQDWLMAGPGIFFPDFVLGILGIEVVGEPVWPAFASLLLVLLGLAYVPAAVDPFRYLPVAVFTVVARLAGVLFFFVLYPGRFPLLFGLIDLTFFLTQGALLFLAWRTGPQESPKVWCPAKCLRWALAAAALGLLLAVLLGVTIWYKLCREEPQQFQTTEEQFKYGSIGAEAEEGIPYWIWRVLPRTFPNHLANPELGYGDFGMIQEKDRDTPVGFSKKVIGFPRIGVTCALCHTGTYRTDAGQEPTIVPGAPATKLDVQRYVRFLSTCAADPRFTADVLMKEIEKETELSWCDRILYRSILVPQTKKGLLKQKERFAWTDARPRWGCGRIDPFNPVKFHQLGMNPYTDPSIGNSDMMPLWTLKKRVGHPLHWDGLNNSLTEVVHSGAIGDGATPKSLPVGDLKRLTDWLQELPTPKYPFPDAIDWKLAKNGEAIFAKTCAVCHDPRGSRFGNVIPLAEIKTDKHRLDMWSQEAADRYNQYASRYPWRFRNFVKHNGYVAVPLDGLWLRAPYLHNGSVPTVDDLLKPAEERPRTFFRGYDVYDKTKLGFISEGAPAEKHGFRFDVAIPGNGNAGHDGAAFGTTLPADQKRALLEFLKIL
jgi:hypothetical protein